ncbi:P-loop containing nucleoside triphosphate hydrolase protein [Cantharellus anzutake]|uniref:P-loop containing nucleoside triphosphate hydrolase protein n=1 Tax=Cantharellus anzutake TaxID=1750568 RepID=UPI001905AD29|nr:P-loop containing nucleoside triphosphate hydrolase protein [Cantharellus anzutake]KAF8326568.1 P-loop containing nucleoside triphosphate hydrolase protein [Cantharellus anzutake]
MAYHLIKGFIEHLTRKEEFFVIIVGKNDAMKGKTFLEKIKSMYNKTPPLPSDKIAPTIGQNRDILQFWDLGGQRDIRNIWERYYDECHAVVYVVDASDVERMSEGWEIFDAVLNHPRIMGLPLLLLANKQDLPDSFSVEAIRANYEEWWQLRNAEEAHRLGGRQIERRMASLNVMGVSAIEGTGIREAVDWLFLRVQNARR